MTKFVAYIDIQRRKLVYMDVGIGGSVSSAERNTDRLARVMPAFVSYTEALPSVGDLFAQAKAGSILVLRSDEGLAIDGPAWVFERKSQDNHVDQSVLEDLLALKGNVTINQAAEAAERSERAFVWFDASFRQ